jgi:hypothetical protein
VVDAMGMGLQRAEQLSSNGVANVERADGDASELLKSERG